MNETLKDFVQAILIIDWWQEIESDTTWSQRVKHELDQLNFYTAVVSNYEIEPDINDPCQFNTIKQYGWYDYQPTILSPLLKECRQRSSNEYIKNRFGSNGFHLLDIPSMQLHLEKSSLDNLKNWLVVGGSWGDCTHHRPIGFYNLKKLPYNFFITDWSMYKNNSIFSTELIQNDQLEWINHGNNLYQLKNDKDEVV